MTVVADPVTRFALAVLASVVAGTLALVAVAILRRRQQVRYFQGVNHLRRTFGPILTRLLAGKYAPDGISALRALAVPDLELVLEPYFSKGKLHSHQVSALRRICGELGLISIWRRRLAGDREPIAEPAGVSAPETMLRRISCLNFLLRAKSARNLGALRDEASWPLLVKALDDFHPDVRNVALRSLASIRAPQSFPALVERLHMAVLQRIASPSQEHLKGALAGFGLPHSCELVPSLHHAHPEVRFLAVDVLREMVLRAAGNQDFTLTSEVFSPELSELLLNELIGDTNPEVRGRAAEVIAYLGDDRSTPALLRLLDDPEWFVRLRAVRAMAKSRFLPSLLSVRVSLTDRQWRVREAAIQTLLSFGQEGASRVFQHFLATDDRACREQIVEAIQRCGLVTSLLEHYAEGGNGLAKKVVEEIAGMGATTCFAGILSSASPQFRQKLLERLNPQLPPQIRILIPATRDSVLGFPEVAQLPPPLAA